MNVAAFDDEPPAGEALSTYDEEHLVTYLRVLDAVHEGADWREIVHVIFGIDVADDPARAERIFNSHLARAKWMSQSGYRQLAARGRTSIKLRNS
ncbi:DNA -binding domain-containing protein [Phenylobacterium haematophilum]|uniref:DNA -binding domain-containing protein n=1 Tax=Phenylobacterium haematophilum TaxID=98513 RepID=UPI001621B1FD